MQSKNSCLYNKPAFHRLSLVYPFQVFQRRIDGSVDFHLYWDDYKNGFGSANHELWMGNERLFNLVNQRSYQLRIDFVNQYGAPYYAKYDSFSINNEANNYRLTIGNYIDGDAGLFKIEFSLDQSPTAFRGSFMYPQ